MEIGDSKFENTLKKLSDKVKQMEYPTVYIPIEKSQFKFNFLSKTKINSYMIYGIIPLIILIILFFWSPKFIMKEVSIEGKLPESKLSIKKLLIYTVIFSSLILSSIFIYFYRKKKYN